MGRSGMTNEKMEYCFITLCSVCDKELKREPLSPYWMDRMEKSGKWRHIISHGVCSNAVCSDKFKEGGHKAEAKRLFGMEDKDE